MNTTIKIIFVLAIALSLVVGLLIGRFALDGQQSGGAYTAGGKHMMPNGSMMHNGETMGQMQGTGTMESMMHDMNAELEGKTGDAFDRAFLEQMIVHHQGAVEMAEKVLEVSKRPELIKLANDIITAQKGEITQMSAWKEAWFK